MWMVPPGSPGISAGGGIVRDHLDNFFGGFALHLSIGHAFWDELQAVMALELAYSRGWSSIWLESDSSYVVSAV